MIEHTGNPCNHDFLSVLHCKKCGEQFNIDWLKALKEVKLEAVAEVLDRLKQTISGQLSSKEKTLALKILEEAMKIEQETYEQVKTKI